MSACWCAGDCPHVKRAMSHAQAQHWYRAEADLREALIDAPDCARAHRMLASVMVETHRANFALDHLRKAKRLNGGDADMDLQFAQTYRNAALVHEAIFHAREAVAKSPDSLPARAVLVNALQGDGRRDEADQIITETEAKFGRHPTMRRVSAVARMDRKDWRGAIEYLAAPDITPLEAFDRGRCHEELGEYPQAWSDWMAGKKYQRERQGAIWDEAQARNRVAALADSARPTRRAHWRRSRLAPAKTIFITGFPRSGTTMVEAMFSAHSKIVAGDELMMLSEVIQLMPALLRVGAPYPRAMMATEWSENSIMPDLLANYYVAKARAKIGPHLGDAAYFTDKMPSNELHWPLIRALFPTAPLYHLQRHPLDCLVSNMSHFLVHGGFVSCAPESFVEHLLMVNDLLARYREHIPDLNATTIRYESFVADHRAEIDRLLPAELEREPACYDFHLNPWHSRTISHRQIKEPVHDKSVGRYKPFLEFLAPYATKLAPLIAREGYTI